MIFKYKTSNLYQSILEKFQFKSKERNINEMCNTSNKEKMQHPLPDATWHRSKSAKFKQY